MTTQRNAFKIPLTTKNAFAEYIRARKKTVYLAREFDPEWQYFYSIALKKRWSLMEAIALYLRTHLADRKRIRPGC